jgi:signal transduction histidine kinase
VKETFHTEAGIAAGGMSARTRNALVFSSALVLLSIGALLTYLTIIRLLDAERWVTHTREVQSDLANINTLMSRAGRNRVEYVQSGDAIHLDDYQAAVKDTLQELAAVKRLTTDNEEQQTNCDSLELLADQRIGLMGKSIDLKRRGVSSLENEAKITQGVVRIAGEMDSVIRQMQGLEENLLAQRQARTESLFWQAVALFSAAFVIAVSLLGIHYYLLNRELRARQYAEESLRRLNTGLWEMQDAERRKISRELHDSLGQYLSGVKMNLEVVSKSLPPNALLAECVAILDESISETRTMSHLLHPPLLDEIGFASAARWYVDGFSQRSGIRVSLTLPDKLKRLPGPVELALYRVLQESLTNIHRHSQSASAEITVFLLAEEIELLVRDKGKGIAPDVLEGFQSNSSYVGVGLVGLRERLRELGGRLEVHRANPGTSIVANLPIPEVNA